MTTYHHVPVLLHEVPEYLALRPGGIYIDATFGGGGHTRALLEADRTIRVIACDWDKEALELNGPELEEEFGNRVTLVWTNFAKLQFHLKRMKIAQVDGILADFGTSRYQIETGAGFSCTRDTPLDMRMSSAHQKLTAADLLARVSERELVDIIGTYGEERYAKKIAQAIIEARLTRQIRSTRELAELIERIVPRAGKRIHPATKTFQALRIVVNKELDHIYTLMEQAPSMILTGGRMVAITFHSLEDRLVKRGFADHKDLWEIVTPKGITASDKEIERNPPSRSARLRAAIRR